MKDKKEKRYYVYHVPGVKIGMTNNLQRRVHDEQGYSTDEYEVIYSSDNIDLSSGFEIMAQEIYNYTVDMTPYKDLVSNKHKQNREAKSEFKVNPTVQTTTFPVPLSKLNYYLSQNIGKKWETPQGFKFEVCEDCIPWLIANARISMFDSTRCYVYNTAFNKWIGSCTNTKCSAKPLLGSLKEISKDQNVYDLIRLWAKDKGIYEKGDGKTQYIKLMEEAGELARGLLKNDLPEIKDAIGDIVVVLTNLAALEGLNIEDCVTSAYDVIKSRQGNMINGTFVKNDTL